MMNGVSQGTSTTNANGIATWSITLGDWGNKHFHIGNATLDLTVTGWRVVADNQYEKVQYNEDTAQVILHTGSIVFGTSWAVQSANILGSAKSLIKPSMPVISLNSSNSLTALSIKENGELWKKSYTGSSVTTGAYCLLEWHY